MKIRDIKHRRQAQVMAEADYLFGDFLKTKISRLHERCLVLNALNQMYDAKGRRNTSVVAITLSFTSSGTHTFL